MRGVVIGVLSIGGAACASDLDTGVLLDSASTGVLSTTGGSVTTTTGLPSTSSEATSTAPSTTTTSEPVTGESSGASVTGLGSSESTAADTDAPVGNPCGAEQKVCVVVELDGMSAGSCGETLDLKGITQEVAPGVWSIEDCGGCELCGGPTYTLEFVAPMEWAPDALPLCSRVAIDFAAMDAMPWACSFVGVSVFADDGLGEEAAPMYIGTSVLIDPPTTVGGLDVARENLEPELCDESSCCHVEPGTYAITFSGAGISPALTLEEKSDAMDVGAFGRTYDVHVERSHSHKECDRIPHFDWVFRR